MPSQHHLGIHLVHGNVQRHQVFDDLCLADLYIALWPLETTGPRRVLQDVDEAPTRDHLITKVADTFVIADNETTLAGRRCMKRRRCMTTTTMHVQLQVLTFAASTSTFSHSVTK